MHAPTHPRLLVYMPNAADLRCGVVRRGAGHLLTRTALATPVWSCHHSRPHQRRRLKRSLYVTLLLILANAADRPSVQAKTLCVMGMTPASPLPRRPHFRLWASLNPSTWLIGVCGCANRRLRTCVSVCVCVCVCVCVYMHAYNLFLYMADMNVYL